MEMDIETMIREVSLKSIIKKKLAEGLELTEKEKEDFLQCIYQSTRSNLKDSREMNKTTTKIAFKTMSIISLLVGDKLKGFHTACRTTSLSIQNNVDNYNRVLKGVDITAKNPIAENFKTLLTQYEVTDAFEEDLLEYLAIIIERAESYKKDLASPIAPEIAEKMQAGRNEILDLDKKYIKK